MPQLILFDIDGTLILTGRAGVRAMNHAFRETLSIGEALADIPLAGRTDRAIIAEALARFAPAHEADEAWVVAFRDRYLDRLRVELDVDHPGKRVLPGIGPLLDALETVPDTHVALLTGNFARGAEVKLGYFDLWRRFKWGAYGDATTDRNALLPVAMQRAREAGLMGLTPADVVVIGDTPHDVACAHSGGARAVAVATGPFSEAALADTGAEVVLPDLADTRGVLDALARLAVISLVGRCGGSACESNPLLTAGGDALFPTAVCRR